MNPFREEGGNSQQHLIMSSMPSPPRLPAPGPATTTTMPKATECKEWGKCAAYSLCATVVLILCATAVLHFIILKATQQQIRCYECIQFTGMDAGEPGLPYEEKCFAAPKNWRVCNYGEICAMAHMKGGGMSRFHRSCTSEKKVDCSGEILTIFNTIENYCYCDKDFCKD